MPLLQDWPTPVTFPKYNYQFTFKPVEMDLDGSDPDNPSLSFKEMFKDLTSNPTLVKTANGYSVKGDGILDKLLETAQLHLDAQFQSNRIKQEGYAESHLQMYLATLQMFQSSIVQFEIERMRLKLQLALENAKMELQLQMAREQNESAERQNSERIDAQAKLVDMQVQSEEQKKHLYRRQIEGFDEDFAQKIFKIQLDSWAVGASIARDSFIGASYTPAAIGKASIDSTYTSIITNQFDTNKYFRALSTIGVDGMP